MDRTMIIFFSAAALLSSLLSVQCVASALVNNSDQSALLELKTQFSYNFFLQKNWSASSEVCSWMGVRCSGGRQNRVTGLNISGMSLTGSVPPQLGNLSFLIYLDIRNNNFSGTLPEELAELRHLKYLNVQSNSFSGMIPSFIGSLSELEFLYLSQNGFSGGIPSSLSNISKLEILDLAMNFLVGSIPGEIGHLQYLTVLDLRNNQLTGPIPPSIFNLSLVQYIALSTNHMSGSLPADICLYFQLLKGLYLSYNEFDGQILQDLDKCPQLQVLDLSVNQFEGNIPREIGNLTLLKDLTLRYNNFQGSIPIEIANLQRLEVLDIGGNILSGSIPETVFNISTLRLLGCSENLLSGNLPSNVGQGLPNLEEILLGLNNFGGSIPDSIWNASKLTALDLPKNSFTGIIPKSLGNLASLEWLNLGHNNLMTEPWSSELRFITSLTNCRNLKVLVIGENPFSGVLPSSIGNLSNSLQIFAAYGCKIRGNIPEDIGNLSQLYRLSLNDNDLSGFLPRTMGDLLGLQQLNLENNNVIGSLPISICYLQKLGELVLSGNQISGPVPSCIANISSLRYIFLNSNNFSSSLPSSLGNLRDLLMIDASSNSLSGHLPSEIGNLEAITAIDFSNNKISGSIPGPLDRMQGLNFFKLARNELEGPIPSSFGQLLSLETLDLSFNKLTGMIPQSLEGLLYLKQFNVSFNQLSGQIPSGGTFINFTGSSFISNAALCGAPRFQVHSCPFRKKRPVLTIYIVLGISSLVLPFALGLIFKKWQKRKKVTFENVLSPPRTHEWISYHELARITNGFSNSNLVGKGSYSFVYKGTLDDGTVLAIKVFNLQSTGALKTFVTECEVLCSIRHRNITRVISSSTHGMDFRAVILEYMPYGSLEKWLHSVNYFLDILQRLNIMIDVASALDYLHNGYYSSVVHCDVKPSNVLLDKDMVGHVCDFGIAKLLGAGDGTVKTQTLATIGYIAPEYGFDGLVSTKCDVYSFGITLMETFTGRRPSDDMYSDDMTLRQWIQNSFPSAIMEVVDSNLLKQDENLDAKMECVSSVMELALKCTAISPDSRMDMHDVLSVLGKLKNQFTTSCGRNSCKRTIATLC